VRCGWLSVRHPGAGKDSVGGDGCGGGGGAEFGYAVDHVAYGLDAAESFVGYLDVEGLFDLEGDVDLVEGVDVELVEGAGQCDGVRRDALRFGDDVNTAVGNVVHGEFDYLWVISTYSDARADVKAGSACTT
jgi:hypothetical protein